MSQITDAIDRPLDAGAPRERTLGFAIAATSPELLAAARAALDVGVGAAEAVARCLPGAPAIVWSRASAVRGEGIGLAQASYRGHVLTCFDDAPGRALAGTLRLADELPLLDGDEATVCHTLVEAARVTVADLAAGADLASLVGDDVELRLARIGDTATAIEAPLAVSGRALAIVDRSGDVAVASEGPAAFLVDRADKPWLVGFAVGEPVLTVASILHASIDRALELPDAASAPRLALAKGAGLVVDQTLPPGVSEALAARGHALVPAPSVSGVALAAISIELYRHAHADTALAGACATAERGDAPLPVPMPARGQNFTIGPAGHDG